MSYNYVPLTPDPEGHFRVTLGNLSVELVTRFNYTIRCWTMDIFDTNDNPLVSGLMLFPGVDILKGETNLKAQLGTFMIVENSQGDYMYPDNLGSTTALLWFPPGTEAVFP